MTSRTAMPAATSYRPLPGPVDREDFAEAQTRHRRARRRYTAASAVAMLAMGVPLAVVVSPLLFLVVVLGSDLLNLLVAVPDVSAALAPFGFADPDGGANPLAVALIVADVLVPGAIVHVGAWMAVRRLFARAGGGAALTTGARDPQPGELEERQLVNVVEEIAIACGIAAPRVQLIDSDVPNVAVIGADIDDATLIVTTGLLAALSRDETQAVVAHAVGAAANGDLEIGTTIATVTQTIGLMSTLLSVPTSAAARRVTRRLVRLVARPSRDRERAANELAELLASTTPPDDEGRGSRVLRVVLFPVAVAGGVYSLTRTFYTSLFVNPVLRRGWRTRKQLADATSVELTRNPDAVARALGTLAGRGDLLPGAEWASHLFFVGPEGVMARNVAVLQERLRASSGERAGLGFLADRDAMTALAAMATVADAATFHPPVGDRLAALRRLGASADVTPALPGPRRRSKALAALLMPFRIVAFAFQLAVPVFAMVVGLFLGGIYVVPIAILLHEVLRS